ncbi:hypothetical protein [Geobacter sp. SVR]|uniref:hypothetical protein n=1 Tax=Geobacter sp. SVR TaxID=2495594 RepID=UPI00143F0005|nr:hypothetical protein [Geobacter sp. SVR]BCS53026.1 hypothetical protein GSVR_13340 [Geobacter sp. SVR]GCF84411.1 hypothetical protein GSbR_10110 [Geobacter sp. SVR]
MQKIPLMVAEAGMVLARDVFRSDNLFGMPICGKGTVLTDSLITRLDHMDVKSICVEGHPVWLDGDRPLDEMLRDLDRRFEKVRQDPLTSKLYEIHASYLKNSMGEYGGRKAE